MAISEILREACSVLWPRACFGCGAVDITVCEECRRLVERVEHRSIDGVPLVTIGAYEGVLRRLVLASKEDGAVAVTNVLGGSLGRLIARMPNDATIVAVPSSTAGWVRRGFDPLTHLLRAAGANAVTLRGDGAVQKRRSAAQRAQRGTLSVRARDVPFINERPCVLLDDVVTTGATMRAAGSAVRDAGGRVDGAIALAWVRRSR